MARRFPRLLLLVLLLSSALAQRSEGVLLRYLVPVGTLATYRFSQTITFRFAGEALAALGGLFGGEGEGGPMGGEEIPPLASTISFDITQEVLSADDAGRVVRQTIDLGQNPPPVVLTVRVDPLGNTTLLEGDLSLLAGGEELPFDLNLPSGSLLSVAPFPVRPLAVGESFGLTTDVLPDLFPGITPQVSGVTTLRRLLTIGGRQVAKLVTDLTIAADVSLDQFLGPEGLGGLAPGEGEGIDLSGVQVRLEGAGQLSALYDLDGLLLNSVSASTMTVTLDISQNTDPLVAFLALLFPSQDIAVTSRVEAIEVRRP